MTDVIKWTFYDGVTTYTLPINPNEMGTTSRSFQKESGPSGINPNRPRGRQTKLAPVEWTFSGKLYSQASYDAMVSWVGLRKPITLTDHLLRQFTVVLTEFRPTDLRRPGLERWSYEMRALILEAL